MPLVRPSRLVSVSKAYVLLFTPVDKLPVELPGFLLLC
jgi:hypothetical protein